LGAQIDTTVTSTTAAAGTKGDTAGMTTGDAHFQAGNRAVLPSFAFICKLLRDKITIYF
jgi:hypothetical protein